MQAVAAVLAASGLGNMIDHGSLPESFPYSASDPPRAVPVATSMDPLETRVQRLEDAVAGLQDTRQLEERVVQRLSGQIASERVRAASSASTMVLEAGQRLLPASLGVMAAGSHAAAGTVRRALGALLDACGDLRSIVNMFFDHRYRLGWSVRLLPLTALVVILLSWFFLSGIWVIGPWLDKAVDLLLAFFVYRVLSCEAARYRQTVGSFPPGR
jgi:hypothetical protein